MLLNGGIYFSHIFQIHGFIITVFIMNQEYMIPETQVLSTEVVHIGVGAY